VGKRGGGGGGGEVGVGGGGGESAKKKKGSDDDVTVGITAVYEHVTLLLVAWRRVCWRAFLNTVKKLKVDTELVSS